MKEKYVFLGGHRKCGTTMLLNLFDEHEQCCVYPTDISVLYGYFPKYLDAKYTIEERLNRLDLVIFATLKSFLKVNNIEDKICLETMRNSFFEDIDKNKLVEIDYIIKKMVSAFRKVWNKPVAKYPIVILKETSVEIYAKELSEKFENSQFVELLRDPRDNYAALLSGAQKYYKKFGEDEKHLLMSLIHRVGLSTKLSESNIEFVGKDRFLSEKFETLTEELSQSIEKLCDFIGIKVFPSMFVPTVLGNETKGNNFEGKAFSSVTSENVGRWKERIGELEAKVIEFYLGEIMEKNGYSCFFSKGEQAIAAAEFYKWSNYQYFFKDSFVHLP